MENAGAKHHRERMGVAIREEISTLVEGELSDPRIGLVSVSEVLLAPDGRSARIYVTVDGSAEETALSLEGLNAARNYIRRQLTVRLQLRQAPELTFSATRGLKHTARVDELLKRIQK